MLLSTKIWTIAMSCGTQGESKTMEAITELVREQVKPLYAALIDTSAMLSVYTEGRVINTTRTQALMALTEAYEALSKAREENNL